MRLLLIILLLAFGISIPAKEVKDSLDNYDMDVRIIPPASDPDSTQSCMDCHSDQMQHKVKHLAAVIDCKNCHEARQVAHPGEQTGFVLKDKVPQLCFNCHAHIPKGQHIHPPVQEGRCLECHNPHSSPNKRLWLKPTSGELCLTCHKDHLKLESKNMLHEPVAQGECHECHNPHSTDTKKFLKADVPRLCLKCHKDKRKSMKMDHVHVPFSTDCRICHEPHGSKEGNLRRMQIVPLCTMCHPQIAVGLRKFPVVHGAVNIEKNCANCHSPHASPHDKQLLGEVKEVCLNCHNKTIAGAEREIPSIGNMIKEGNHVHGAITQEGCTACHNPHAAEKNRLLLQEFSIHEYVPGKKESFELCFKCHDSKLFEEQTTTTATNFRKGDKNLHFVHVNREEKGRNCKLCHNIHGSPNNHMINEKAQFGRWEMPLNYNHREDGGSCLPGCHEQRTYSREIP